MFCQLQQVSEFCYVSYSEVAAFTEHALHQTILTILHPFKPLNSFDAPCHMCEVVYRFFHSNITP